jgi:site-specific DNA-methyltransferase (adenine-specific)
MADALPAPYYKDDAVMLYNADCRAILPLLGSVDHVLTDPPFSERTHAGARTNPDYAVSGGNMPHSLVTFDSISVDDLRATWELCSDKVSRWFVSFLDWRHMHGFEDQPPAGLRFVRHGIWVKPNGAPQFTGDRPATGWESIAILHKAGGRMRWNGGGHHAVYTYNKQNEAHPTAKPIALVKRLLADYTDPGDLVLDMFAGGGTVGRACKDMGRRAILIEQNARYCDLIIQRLQQSAMLFEEAAA